ncbi:hypothetical protein [Paenibacillus larvae]|uniref:hypothetical protein n=1 Tax=Paenibacillus larvae TaxID=1464 RepID=UPI0028903381|nr:hypothetical protein [Paenibacillus larvae]MDT2194456.1 hypothetical protein [Paenibacillus larvae]
MRAVYPDAGRHSGPVQGRMGLTPIDAAYPMERIASMLSGFRASTGPDVLAVFAVGLMRYRGIVAGTSVEHIVYLDRLESRLNRTSPVPDGEGGIVA